MLSKRLRIFSNIVLSVVFISVLVLCFVPTESQTVLKKNSGVYYRGNESKNNVSLMFNVYKDSETVKNIVGTLKEFGVKATFFIGGCWADDNGETLNYLVENGQEIANHGYFHKDHKTLNYDNNRQEINVTGVIIYALCGVKPTLFAPPSGSYSSTTLDVAEELNYKVIMWTIDTIDWRDKDESLVYKRATSNLNNGNLILMHPEKHTLKALPNIIKTIKDKGFNIVTVSENISE